MTLVKRLVMFLYSHRVLSMRATETIFRALRLSRY